MGSLGLPLTSPIYIDANILIYSVERVAPHAATLHAFWRTVRTSHLTVLTSELTVLETLIGPMKAGNHTLEVRFRRALFATSDLQLQPVTLTLLEHAARLRAAYPSLKTPDAIHAATALDTNCALMLTNDLALQQVAGLTVATPRNLATS